MTIVINGITYQINEGCVYKKTYNETLDSATVKIDNVLEANRISMTPFDSVIFDNKYMLINDFVETMVCVKPVIYSYEINLFSETKLLENVILPNRKITARKTGNQRTVLYYLNQYLNKYAPKERVYNSTTGYFTWVKKYSYENTQAFNDKFNVVCPEMQWNTPTLREVITDLMMVVDCIPVMSNGIISFIDLTKKQNDIKNYQGINYIQRSQSAEDYASELQMNLVNVLQTKVNDNVKNTIVETEFIPFSTSDNEYIIDSKNILLKTAHPIYNIKSLKVAFLVGKGDRDQNYYAEKDLVSFGIVKEKKEFDILKVAYKNDSIDTSSWANISQYKNYCLYYSFGGNTIQNFEYVSKENILGYQNITIQWLKNKILSLYSSQYVGHDMTDDNFSNAYFKIEYETTDNVMFRAGKVDYVKNERVVMDNQTNSFVDAFNQGSLEYQKINRLGNDMLMINQHLIGNGTKIDIGDYYDDFVVYNVEYQYYVDHTEINAYLTKNYILRNYFTGIKAKIRSWVNATDEALTRIELVKTFCEFSFNPYYDAIDISGLYASYFLSFNSNNFIQYCGVYTTDSDNVKYPANIVTVLDEQTYRTDYSLAVQSRIVGNSLVLSVGFNDNWFVSTHARKTVMKASNNGPTVLDLSKLGESQTDIGGIPLEYYRYVNSDGEFNNITLKFAYNIDYMDGFKSTSGDNYYVPNFTDGDIVDRTSGVDEDVAFVEKVMEKPLIYDSAINRYSVLDIRNMDINKDNAEILQMSVQFEFCIDNHDIGFTKDFVNLQQGVRYNALNNIKVYLSDTGFDYRNPVLPSDATEQSYGITVSDSTQSTAMLSLTTSETIPATKYVYVCNGTTLLLCWKGSSYIYLNLLKSRNKSIKGTTKTIGDNDFRRFRIKGDILSNEIQKAFITEYSYIDNVKDGDTIKLTSDSTRFIYTVGTNEGTETLSTQIRNSSLYTFEEWLNILDGMSISGNIITYVSCGATTYRLVGTISHGSAQWFDNIAYVSPIEYTEAGSTVYYQLTADAGYQLNEAYRGTLTVNSTDFNISGDTASRSFSACTPIPRNVSFVLGNGVASITYSYGTTTQTIFDSGIIQVNNGTSLQWYAIPASGYSLDSGVPTQESPATIVVDSNKTLTATATLIPILYTLVGMSANGTVKFYNSHYYLVEITTAHVGDTIYYQITPNTGYTAPSPSSGAILVNSDNFTLSGTTASKTFPACTLVVPEIVMQCGTIGTKNVDVRVTPNKTITVTSVDVYSGLQETRTNIFTGSQQISATDTQRFTGSITGQFNLTSDDYVRITYTYVGVTLTKEAFFSV